MTDATSIFHALQREGARSLRLTNLRPGFEVNAGKFIPKVLSFQKFTFPIYVIDANTINRINQRIIQIHAAEGVTLEYFLSEEDRLAKPMLPEKEQFSGSLPAARFGFEIFDTNNHAALLVEAIRSAEVAFSDTTTEVPHTISECEGMKLSDCNNFHMYYLYKDTDRAHSNIIFLESLTVIYGSPHSLQEKGLRSRLISGGLFTLTKAPKEGSYSGRDIFFGATKETAGKHLDAFTPLFGTMLNFLWVLSRESEVVITKSQDFSAENKKRKKNLLKPFSPIRVINIDEENLRRVEVKRASEIADALTNRGGYKIPGLVLVSEHTKKKSGTQVDAYARCADEVVRKKATEYLREKDYDGLAILVRDFGHRTTQELFGVSHIYVPRLI